MNELEKAMSGPVSIEQQIRNMIAAKDGQGYQRLRQELGQEIRALRAAIQNGDSLAPRRDKFVYALVRTSALLYIVKDYHTLSHDARIASGSWSRTLSAIFANYELSKEDERVVAKALEKLIESKRAQHAVTQQLIEALTTVLPQGG